MKPELVAESYSQTVTNQLQNMIFFTRKVISHQGKLIKEGFISWWFPEEWEAMPPFPAVSVISSMQIPIQKLVLPFNYSESKTHLCLLSGKRWRNDMLTS